MSDNTINDTINKTLSQLPPDIKNLLSDSRAVPVGNKRESVQKDKRSFVPAPPMPEDKSRASYMAELEAAGPVIASVDQGATLEKEDNNEVTSGEIHKNIFPDQNVQRPRSVKKVHKTHPILESIKHKLGITKKELKKSKEIMGSIWGFYPLSNRDSFLVTEIISEDSPLQELYFSEIEGLSKAAEIAVSVRTVDDVPLYELFGLDVSDFDIKDPLDPPRDLKRVAALELLKVLLEGTDQSASIDALYRQYERLVGDRAVLNYNNDEQKYSCPTCGKLVSRDPRFDAGGRELPYYCVFDGTVLEKLEVLSSDNIPLS